jgi:hypothetical protein
MTIMRIKHQPCLRRPSLRDYSEKIRRVGVTRGGDIPTTSAPELSNRLADATGYPLHSPTLLVETDTPCH